MIRTTAVLLAALALWALDARAETGLVEVCLAGETGGSGSCPDRAWLRPTPDHAVHSCPAGTAVRDCGWADEATAYRRFGDLADDALVWICTRDIEPGPFSDEDPCGNRAGPKPPTPKSEIVTGAPILIVDGRATLGLSFSAPTEATDDTPLAADEIEGYTLFWGAQSRAGRDCAPPASATDSTCYPNRTQFDSAGRHELEIAVSESTTLYFAAVTRHANGNLSDYSAEVSKPVEIEVSEPEPTPNPPTMTIEVVIDADCTTSDPRVTCSIRVE